ncbi:MAG: nitrous oxide reductase accessory protein NosL [Sulfurovaceae bacterium]|nr:nitrous oxide reductase accessory protein NosL [Sulfurovaceae bacterium]
MFKKLVLFTTLTLALFAFDKSVPNGKIYGTSSCPICGMHIKKFYKTSHAVTYNDGKKEHFCSMSYLAKTMKKRKDIKAIFAVDASTNKLINAKTAIYVVGSDIPNTMGSNQVAFASKSSAKAFHKKHGGKIVSFNTALKN